MIPKDKASDLFRKILGKNPNRQDGISIIDTIHAKQCALIAVDEVIQQLTPIEKAPNNKFAFQYWQEVKNEIESL